MNNEYEYEHVLAPWGMSGKKHCVICGAIMNNSKDYNSKCPGETLVTVWQECHCAI